MHSDIAPRFHDQPWAADAKAIIGACVHCGFCTATCPTYVELRDERDGPRGRIYLIKEMLEGTAITERTRRHLDRCLACRSCETTCPSGVRYGRLIDIARSVVETELPRSPPDRLRRWGVRKALGNSGMLAALLALGRKMRPVLPAALVRTLGQRRPVPAWPQSNHSRVVVALAGCVQQAAAPTTNPAAARVLDRLGIRLVVAPAAGCCGALSYHMGDAVEGLGQARRNIDAWWPLVEAGAEAIVPTASGCGSFIHDYAEVLAGDPIYAAKAGRISALARDLGEILLAEDLSRLGLDGGGRKVAVHVPCSQQHALHLPDLVETILGRLGFAIGAVPDKHLCCGSGGANSILEADLGRKLRRRKLDALTASGPEVIVTANIGCQLHLRGGTGLAVMHWIELLAEALP